MTARKRLFAALNGKPMRTQKLIDLSGAHNAHRDLIQAAKAGKIWSGWENEGEQDYRIWRALREGEEAPPWSPVPERVEVFDRSILKAVRGVSRTQEIADRVGRNRQVVYSRLLLMRDKGKVRSAYQNFHGHVHQVWSHREIPNSVDPPEKIERRKTKTLTRQELKREATGEIPEHWRPQTRGDCGKERPCPYVGCRYHLYLDVNPLNGSIKLNFPDLEVEDLPESCALDLAEKGRQTLEEIGEAMSLVKERVRQIELVAIKKLQASAENLREYYD